MKVYIVYQEGAGSSPVFARSEDEALRCRAQELFKERFFPLEKLDDFFTDDWEKRYDYILSSLAIVDC